MPEWTDWTEREGELGARAKKVGYALIPPSDDRWLLVDNPAAATIGWSTHGSLDLVEEHLAAIEEGGGNRSQTYPPGELPE